MSERLDRVEQLLGQSAQRQSEFEERQAQYEAQRERDRKDWEERDRQFAERMERAEQWHIEFQESLNETKALQQRNAEAISQEMQLISQLRQAIVDQGRQIQENRADMGSGMDPDEEGT
ncbi:MAG: hypothetical protein HC771_21255 [Synechococcales cyanobacterium CRU_2_2]|nr:hypothetical protein [Synechococcales cyanobacterium CRU_2_2]